MTTAPLTPTTTTDTAVPTAPGEVRLDRYAIEPATVIASAGTVSLTAVNADQAPHDVVLLRTTRAPDALPSSGVRIDEADPSIEVLARTPRLEPGATGVLTVSLGPGTYVLVCTVPHHYVREAMVATLIVAA